MASYKKFLLLSHASSIGLSVISTCGIVFLVNFIELIKLLLGAGYQSNLDQLVNKPNPPHDPVAIARACYSAAFIYSFILVFTLFQVIATLVNLRTGSMNQSIKKKLFICNKKYKFFLDLTNQSSRSKSRAID